MACKYYYAGIFLHLLMAFFIAGLSADKYNTAALIYGNTSALMQNILNICISLGLIYGIYNTRMGFLKYIFFMGFAFWIGQSIKSEFMSLQSQDLLKKTLLYTGGIFVGMTALAMYDSGNFLGLTPYLFAGLIGLIVARMFIFAYGTKEEKKQDLPILNIIAIVIFALLLARDVQTLRIQAQNCTVSKSVDYPSETLNIFVDIINIFVEFGRYTMDAYALQNVKV
jgi:FtsH-binding integral membrane protein